MSANAVADPATVALEIGAGRRRAHAGEDGFLLGRRLGVGGDADFGPAPILAIDIKDRQPQTTFERRTGGRP